MIFVNLPVADVKRSRAFYEALGFSINEQFSDETAASVVISEHIYLMILDHAKFDGFAPRPRADTLKTTSALIALDCADRAAVDAMMDVAIANGGTDNDKLQDMDGFMYGRSFSDPDGHVFEPFWMNPEAVN
jgi:predicted lactoylglutathione lyase